MIMIKPIRAEETWPIRHRVMWPNESLVYVKLKEDQDGHHFGLHVADELVAVVSLFPKGDSAQFRKLATLKNHQKKGYGSALIRHILAYSSHNEISSIWCNARAEKQAFYRQFGFQTTSQTFIKNGQSYVTMEKTI
ncbi:GNAT family N-acetyltransferase [Roseivirga misakiensis]|uniref:GNAT family N-acetyltransferase n=2 Tax=Roseivirga misakiensis TaxID=1563681 RepID=A0A1E5T2Q0_9BACT|nr:GNAT family N-acetyltransferase [Roseivirga misakiensis]